MSREHTALSLHPFTRRVGAALRRRCRVKPDDHLLLAVSGGADSVALLRGVAAVAAARGSKLRLTVAHVHHGVRAEADADAAFVEALSAAQALPCRVRRLDPSRFTGNAEAAMRRARYAALAGMAQEMGASAVVTAHHADDQLETVLMRMLRGASVRGLAGLAWRRRVRTANGSLLVLRPMLAATHDEAVACLRTIDQPWREDATNADAARWRARLRRDVLPVLRELRGDAATRAVELGDHLREVARLLARSAGEAGGVVRAVDGAVVLDRAAARRLDAAVLLEVLRRAMIDAGAEPDRLPRRTLLGIARAVRDRKGGERTFSPAGVRVTVTQGFVTVRRAG